MLEDRHIALEIDDKARAWLAGAGYDPVYGARPLKRIIQRNLQNPLANLLLEGKVADGDTVPVTADIDGLLIDGRTVKAEAA
jgi:ATP-dependent Clp protease ATP-binding subunit ClpB